MSIQFFDHPKQGRVKVGDIIKSYSGYYKIDSIEKTSYGNYEFKITRILNERMLPNKKPHWRKSINTNWYFEVVNKQYLEKIYKKCLDNLKILSDLIDDN